MKLSNRSTSSRQEQNFAGARKASAGSGFSGSGMPAAQPIGCARTLFVCVLIQSHAWLAYAGDAQNTPNAGGLPFGFQNWLANTLFVLGVTYLLINMYRALKPQPPYDEKFAAYQHQHADYITDGQFRDVRNDCSKARRELTESLSAEQAKLQDDVSRLRKQMHSDYRNIMAQLTSQFQALDKSAEKRSCHLHNRIDPLAEAIRSNQDLLNSHLEDHRRVSHGN